MMFIVGSLNAEVQNINKTYLSVEDPEDCLEEARRIAFFMMDEFDFTEDQAADLVLAIIEDC